MESVSRGFAADRRPLTVSEAAAQLRVDAAHIRLLLRTGRLDGLRFGSQWVVSEESVERYRQRPHPPGRTFSEKVAWSLLAAHEGSEVPWRLHREEQARVSRYAQQSLASLSHRLRGRARPQRLSVGPRMHERLSEHPLWRAGGLDLARGDRLSVIYVPARGIEALI